MTDLVRARSPFIDGRFEPGRGAELRVFSPATEAEVAVVEGASPEQVEAAIAAARRGFDTGPWPSLEPAERIAALRRFGAALEKRRALLIETVIQEAGCPRGVTELTQVGMALSSIRELCELYSRMPSWEHNEVPLADHLAGASVRLSIRRFEPAGVVAAITPYNFPLITNVWKVVPALLAGCTVVLRPSPFTPLEALVFGEAAQEAELPPGVLNVVADAGSAAGELLSKHPAVDVVSFTGSTAVGRAIAAQGAATLKRVILELGGKSVQLHLPDRFEQGVASVVGTSLAVFAAHAGQGCALQTRLLVPETQRAAVVEAVAAAAKSLPIGDPSKRENLVGPLISEAQRERVHGIVSDAIAAGAKLITGGRRPPAQAKGWFYEPTLLDLDSPDNPCAQREVFGPVLGVLGYRDLDHAIAIANHSELGLSGGIYTGDLALGLRLAERIRSGTVQVNAALPSGYTPMGGYKQSGYGRERGAAGIRAFQELKHIVIGNA
jgi:acyl-CoA reductase-like NAD-dependent aldehyde dehydrogenase